MEHRFYFTKNRLIVSLFFTQSLSAMQHDMATHYAMIAHYKNMYPNADHESLAYRMQNYKQGPVFSELDPIKKLPEQTKRIQSNL